MRIVFRLSAMVFYRYRYFGAHHIPETGGGLICSNHQSNLDPALVGIISKRHLNFVAKDALFFFPLNVIIYLLDAIPVTQEGMSIAGIKETLKRTKRGELALIFPEGHRTHNGDLLPFMPGFITIARRTKVPLIPVGMDGAYQAWPRHRSFPLPGRVVVVAGEPIHPEQYLSLTDEQIIELLQSRIRECFEEAKRIRLKR
ncbi:MAG TPA: lysophospholipid acyltransferase family protein [Pirellulaceae bacterium]|nr:lysophospholipid acyltransferase family protein [Pirellulaceae bacterium]